MSNQDTIDKMLREANELAAKTTPEEASNTNFLDAASKPSLRALSYALRHPEFWPKGFVWDYGDCKHCAMGLARKLWDEVPVANQDNGASFMAQTFAMPYSEAQNIFMGHGKWQPTTEITNGYLWWKKTTRQANHSAITPDMVADQIDKYLANKG